MVVMSEPLYIAFVDESGCDGDKFERGSSEFLILSAVVGIGVMQPDIDMRLDALRNMSGKPDDWQIPKFEKAPAPVRWAMCQLFADLPFYSAHVVIHKPSIRDNALRTDKNRLYRYASKLLVERISWICDAMHTPGAPGELCEIIFSQDLSRCYSSFKDYIARLSAARDRINTSIKWKHISADHIRDVPFRKLSGLLLADYHASALGLALEKKKFGQYDDRLARILNEAIRKSRTHGVFSYGYKLWPKEAESLFNKDDRFSWMR
jgi:hypothetical protein